MVEARKEGMKGRREEKEERENDWGTKREGWQFREILHSTVLRTENSLERALAPVSMYHKKIRLSPSMETRPGWLLCHWFLRHHVF